MVNDAAVLRNAGVSPEAAAAKAAPASLDRQTQEIRAKQKSDPAQQTRPARLRRAPSPGAARRSDRSHQRPSRRQEAGPDCERPSHGKAAAGSQPAAGQTQARSTSEAANPWPISRPPANKTRRTNIQARNAKQDQAAKHTNKHFAGFDVDWGEYAWKPRADLALFVNARTPYSMDLVRGQIHDPRKLVLAFPLNSFASDKVWAIKKELKEVALKDPDQFKDMYQATKDTWNSWQNAPGEDNQKALDQLELGRRVLAEVGIKMGVLPLDKTVKQGQPFKTQKPRRCARRQRSTPGIHQERQRQGPCRLLFRDGRAWRPRQGPGVPQELLETAEDEYRRCRSAREKPISPWARR